LFHHLFIFIQFSSPLYHLFNSDNTGTWKYNDSQEADCEAAFKTSLENGIDFLDTAEIYGNGKSEELIAKFIKNNSIDTSKIVIASKFMPSPTYFSASNLATRFELSCKRLGVDCIDLYQVHGMILSIRSVEVWMEELAKLHKQG
jgi:aryl-alcohol dehydrogenase-like predicted oxidoreductase